MTVNHLFLPCSKEDSIDGTKAAAASSSTVAYYSTTERENHANSFDAPGEVKNSNLCTYYPVSHTPQSGNTGSHSKSGVHGHDNTCYYEQTQHGSIRPPPPLPPQAQDLYEESAYSELNPPTSNYRAGAYDNATKYDNASSVVYSAPNKNRGDKGVPRPPVIPHRGVKVF